MSIGSTRGRHYPYPAREHDNDRRRAASTAGPQRTSRSLQRSAEQATQAVDTPDTQNSAPPAGLSALDPSQAFRNNVRPLPPTRLRQPNKSPALAPENPPLYSPHTRNSTEPRDPNHEPKSQMIPGNAHLRTTSAISGQVGRSRGALPKTLTLQRN